MYHEAKMSGDAVFSQNGKRPFKTVKLIELSFQMDSGPFSLFKTEVFNLKTANNALRSTDLTAYL